MSTEFTPPVPAIASQLLGSTVSRRWTARYSLVWFGYWIANLVPLQLLLPQQSQDISPESKVADFAIVNGVSGLVALIALPICDSYRLTRPIRYGTTFGGGAHLCPGMNVTRMLTEVAVTALTTRDIELALVDRNPEWVPHSIVRQLKQLPDRPSPVFGRWAKTEVRWSAQT